MPLSPYDKLCPGCFADKGRRAVCPECGYDESTPRGGLVLPHRTVLNEQYMIGCTLGKLGGFGITYLAWDIHLETPVAIKEYLPRELAGRDRDRLTVNAHSKEDKALFLEGLELFLKEARTLARFDHENIVRVRNVLEENGTAYLVMNFYEGTTLAAHLEQKGGRLPEKIALSILLPVLDGLREVHCKGFLHRDIKPQNIYLTKLGTPILLDFGSARMLMGERNRSMTVLMTPGYAPFEQYHRKGQQGPWTDIYACGATLYQMLTGVVPMEAAERAESDTLQAPESLVQGISPAVSNIVMRAMAMNREARPSTVADFMDALIQANQGRTKPPAGVKHEEINVKPDEINKEPPTENPQPDKAETLSPYFKAVLGTGSVSYYLRIFSRFNLNRVELFKPSWNWAGFIFNAFWLLYRRMFEFGVLFFLIPILAMTIADSIIIGLLCWIFLSFIVGCYGNAMYFISLSKKIDKFDKKFPNNRLQPLKLARMTNAGRPSILIPLTYLFIGLVIIYSNGQFRLWLTTKPNINTRVSSKHVLDTSSKQESIHPVDESLSENTELNPNYDAYQYKDRADDLLKNSNWQDLLALSQKWCNGDRMNPDAWLAFGIANFELAQFALAQPAFETYFRLRPDDNDYVLGYLAKTYVKLKKTLAAEQALVKVIALRSKFNRPKTSDDAFFYNELGNVYYFSNENPQEALQLYQQALNIEPNNETYKANTSTAENALAKRKSTDQSAANLKGEVTFQPSLSSGNYAYAIPQNTTGSLSSTAAAGDIQSMELAISKGANINKMEMGSYPLIQASKHKQGEMVVFLLRNGADINVEDSNGNKAINYSILNGDKKTMDILTNAGAFRNNR